MALERKTRLEAIQFAENGTLMVRIQKRTILDGEVLKEEWHRTSVPPNVSAEAQMAEVNKHLQAMGFEAVPDDGAAIVAQVAESVQTDDVKAAFAAAAEE